MNRFANCRRLMAAALLVVVLHSSAAAAGGISGKEIYRRTLRGTALILGPNGAVGSGWVADVQRLLVTNHHVVKQAETVRIFFPAYRNGKVISDFDHYNGNAEVIRGRVFDTDPQRDLALIVLETLPREARELKMAKESASAGEHVHSLGNPLGAGAFWIYTSGTVRTVSRKKLRMSEQLVDARMLVTQSPMNPGDSGGPVVNDEGLLVGVTSSGNIDAQLISNCIDVTEVRAYLAEVRSLVTPETAYQFFRRGVRRYKQERAVEAMADFTEALERGGPNAVTLAARGFCFNAKADYRTAIADFDQALRLDSRCALAYRGRSAAHLECKQYENVVADCTAALRLATSDSMYHRRGKALVQLLKTEQAFGDFSRAIDLNPERPLYFNDRAALHRSQRAYPEAIADFTASLRLAPTDPSTLKERAFTFRLQGDLTAALTDYDAALRLNAEDSLGYNARGIVYLLTGNRDAAIRDYSEAIRLNPKFAVAYANRGAAQLQKEELDEAIKDCTEAIRLNPNLVRAYRVRSEAFAKLGDAARSEEDKQAAVRLKSGGS